MLKISFQSNSSLVKIGKFAFFSCISLLELSIPPSVKIIKDSAFEECMNLRKLAFMDGSALEFIGDFAFKGCISLDKNKVIIPPGANCQKYTFDDENVINFHQNDITNVITNDQQKCNIY